MRHVTKPYTGLTEPSKGSKKKRYLFNDLYIAMTYGIKYNTPYVSYCSKINKNQSLAKFRDTLSGFLFEDVVPSNIIIEISGKRIKIPTFGERVVLLDIPILILSANYSEITVCLNECKVICNLEGDGVRKRLVQNNQVCFYDGFLIYYVQGVAGVLYFVRPLKNIIQDVVRETDMHVPNLLLMRRSNRDAKALAARVTDSECIVFEP